MFEEKCAEIKHGYCVYCKCVSSQLRTFELEEGSVCVKCHTKKPWLQKNPYEGLPVWYDENNIVQFHVPEELSCLREAEKLLISLVSVYVPLQHLAYGQMGCKGHVCCFEKDMADLCLKLPRVPENVTVVRVVRNFVGEDG